MDSMPHSEVKTTMRLYGICVVVPTYNNVGTLRSVISDVLDYSSDVIVVNDGSTDITADVLREFADKVEVVSYHDNKGKGYALKKGFAKALEKGYEYAITIDSDGQHRVSDLPAFVEAIAMHKGALIVGRRDLTNVDINGKSTFANKFSNFWFAVHTGRRLKDTQTGYRAYPLKKLYGVNLLTSRYEAELELLVFAAWNGVEIKEIPINVYYPPQSERVSHFRPALDFTRISILNTILCFGAILYGLPIRTYDAIKNKKIFKREFKAFTHKNGNRKSAATTLGRLVRSVMTISFFLTTSTMFAPFLNLYMRMGRRTDKKRLRLHKILHDVSWLETVCFPGSKVIHEDIDLTKLDDARMIICNHQSHLDLPVLMAMHPKLIFLTNDWVWNSKYFGNLVRNAEFLPVSAGMDKILPHLKELTEKGYSVVVFPEGTRSADCRIARFHQGAFKLAEELNLDILPMVIHGAGAFLPKNDFMLRKADITLRMLPAVDMSGMRGLPLRKKASLFRGMISSEYSRIVREKEDAKFFKDLVLYKYAWRGWGVVARVKRELQEILEKDIIGKERETCGRVRIINSGIGTFALLYALVNKDVEVHAFESRDKDYAVAIETADLPVNLHYHHAVWNKDYEDNQNWDKTIIL